MLHCYSVIILTRLDYSFFPIFLLPSQLLLCHHVKDLLQRRCDANILRGTIGVK